MAFYLVWRGREEVRAMPPLLGYVFWHWPRSRISRRAYEGKLIAFQESLKAHRSGGLVDALSFRVQRPPWGRPRSETYEDWYLVRDFKSLGALNEAAVAGPNREPHDEVARDASAGAGGVYKLRNGGLSLRDARYATWIKKPARTPYQAFLDHLSRLVADLRTDLWQRQMVLAPAPEFCLHSESRLDIPSRFHPTTVRVRPVGARGDRLSKTDLQRLEGS
jgi:hypothetical protein